MEDTQQQQPTPTPDRDIISLFVSEEPTTPKQRSVSVPVAGMPPTPTPVPVAQIVPPSTPAAPSPVPAPEEQVEEEVVSPFVQKLRDIEDNAKAEIAGWDPIYLGQAAEANAAGSGTGTKRKASELDSDSSDEDSDADSDDEEDVVQPHDPDLQDRPKLPIYHPGFKLTEGIARQILGTFTQYITMAMNGGYKDDEAKHLRAEILNNKTIPYQDAVRLAVAGDTGVGKSALLNSILGVLNLTIESDAGGACTCVITEFKQSPSTQKAPFAAEVEFFCLELCRKMVTDLFTQWYRVKQKQRQDPDEVDDEELNQMTTARDCLKQLFADRLGFEGAEAFMGTATSVTDGKVVGQLLKWTTDIHQMFIADGETSVHFEASTPESLTEQYPPFTREVQNASYNGKPLRFTPWPLIKIVRVSLNSPILQQNVIVADVPGGSDINYFRIENASRYLQSCDMTIVVGEIKRLRDDVSFRQQYLDAYRRRRSGSVILVATKTDNINVDSGSTLVLDPGAEEQLADVAQKAFELEQEIRRLVNEMDHNKLEGKAKANKALKKKKKRFTNRLIALGKQRKDILIATRSKQVTRDVGQNYRADTGDDAGAPVYCVSNRVYMRHLRGFDKTNEQTVPTMTIEQTQIPSFCSHIYVLPSKGRTADLDHYVRVTVPTLLSIIQMSCSTTTLTRVNHLTDIVRSAREGLQARMRELTVKFCKVDIKLLHDELSDRAVQTRFDKAALKSLATWENVNANTHRAICNKKGIYVQKKKGIKMNWNESLMSPVSEIIDQAFRTIIDESCDKFKAEAAQVSKEAMRELDHTLKNDPKALACDAYRVCFKDNLILFNEQVDKLVDTATVNLQAGLTKVHLNAIGLKEDDYFTDAMRDVYWKAYNMQGASKGVTRMVNRCQYLKEAIPGRNGPFSEIAGWAKADAFKAIQKVSSELQTGLDGILLNVQTAFDRMKKKKENDTPQGKKFRTELHQLVAEARRILNGLVHESLDLCKQYK